VLLNSSPVAFFVLLNFVLIKIVLVVFVCLRKIIQVPII
jgi:hypothetical protein